MKIKFTALFLLAAMMVLSFSSCIFLGKPDEEAVMKALEEKLPLSKEATSIIYGEGIRIKEDFVIDPDWTTSHYAEVHPDFKYQTVNSLKELVLSAFSSRYAEEIFEYAFISTNEQMSRFGESKGKLTMDVTKEPFGMATDIYAETARIKNGTAYACTVEVEYSVDNGKTRNTMEIQMIEENGRWVFDGPTY